MALTIDEENFVKNEIKNKDIEKQIVQKISDLTNFKLQKQTEIDEEETKVNGEIQKLRKQIEDLHDTA
jgi:uncharacterized coiled-coil DUF342 family protein